MEPPGPPRDAPRPPRERWADPGAGSRYAGDRWRSRRRAERDPRLVAAILARHLGGGPAQVLDAPCGAGRLRAAVGAGGRRWIGADVSAEMLDACGDGARVRADVERLPFADATFDAVVACRLLHHLRETDAFRGAVAELVRVSRGLVVASFWDAGALPERFGRARAGRGRVAHAKATVRDAFAAAGAEVVGYRHSFRFLSRQTFAVAERRG